MPALLLVAAAYGAYKHNTRKRELLRNKARELQSQSTDETLDEGVEECDIAPMISLENKTLLELLPSEQEFGVYQAAPISTVTFCDGNVVYASQNIGDRLVQVLGKNPWVTGWIIRHSEPSEPEQQQQQQDETEEQVETVLSEEKKQEQVNKEQVNQEHVEQPADDTDTYNEVIAIVTETQKEPPTTTANGTETPIQTATGAGPKLKLCFDPTGQDVSTGQFKLFYPGDIDLCRDTTPYQDFASLFEPDNVLVERNECLLGGENHHDPSTTTTMSPQQQKQALPRTTKAIFKLSLIPDAEQPDERFAVVFSLSHLAGDACTYYQLLDMLLNPDAEILALNPMRRTDFPTALSKLDQKNNDNASIETTNNLQQNIALLSKPTLWNWGRQKWTQEVDPSELRIFAVSNDFVQREKKIEIGVSEPDIPQDGGSLEQTAVSHDRGSNDEMDDPTAPQQGTPTTLPEACFTASATPTTTGASKISTNSVLTSHFFQSTNATVGFMVCNMRRNQLHESPVSELDAGNYTHDIGLRPADFDKPTNVQGWLEAFRRSCRGDTCKSETDKDEGSTDEPPLATEKPSSRRRTPRPKVPINFKLSMSVNWSSFWRESSGGTSDSVLGETSTSIGEDIVNNDSKAVEKGRHQVIQHLPIYDNDFVTKNLPLNFSMMKLFTLQPARSEQQPMKLGAYIVAPRSAWAKIDACGMVDEYLWSFRRNAEDHSQKSTTGGGVIRRLADEREAMSSNKEATLRQEDGEDLESSFDPQSNDSVTAQPDINAPHRIIEYEPQPPPTLRFAQWTKLLRRRGIDASQGSESSSFDKSRGNESVDDETVEDSGGETGDELSPIKGGNDETLQDESPSGASGSQEKDVSTLPLPRKLWESLGNVSLYRKE